MLMAIDKVWRRAHDLLKSIELHLPYLVHLCFGELMCIGLANHSAQSLCAMLTAMTFGEVEVQAYREPGAQRLQCRCSLRPERRGCHATGGRQAARKRQLLHGLIDQRMQSVIIGAQQQSTGAFHVIHVALFALKAQNLLMTKVPMATSTSTAARLQK